MRVLIPVLTRLMGAVDAVRAAVSLAAAEARAELAERTLDDHLATAPREARWWPAETPQNVVQLPAAPQVPAELDGPDFRGVLAFLLALGKVDSAAPVEQVLLHARDRADDVHPRTVHVAARYLDREFVTLVRKIS